MGVEKEEEDDSNEVSMNISKRVKILEKSIQEVSMEAWKYASYDESLEMTETTNVDDDAGWYAGTLLHDCDRDALCQLGL